MGADMMLAAIALRRGAQPDYAAGVKFLESVDFTNEDLLTRLIDDGGLDENEPYFDEDGKPQVEEIRKYMVETVNEFHHILGSRSVTAMDIRDLTMFFTGGMSWGDMPDEAYVFWRLGVVPGLLDVMNFVEDWYEEAKPPVTPEEERQAIQSIVGNKD